MSDQLSVQVRDETTAGDTVNALLLTLERERLTIRELIRSRIYQEVREYNSSSGGLFRGLVQPTDSERELNGYRLPGRRKIDWKLQFTKATEAFERGQVLVLVNDHQVETLDEEIELRPDSSVAFLRIVPLAGG